MRQRLLLAGAIALAGCGGGDGDVEVSVWGEAYIEEGIAAADFEDGGSVRYTKFLIAVDNVSLADSTSSATAQAGAVALQTTTVFDLATPGPHPVGVMSLEATTHDTFGYSVVPVTGASARHSSVAAADAEMMQQNGYSIYVQGTVSGSEVKSFAWGFSDATRYQRCVDVSAGQDLLGVVVPGDESVDAQLTIHGDHLFYDDLQSTDAKLRSAVIIAADADMDGEVTLAELDAVPLASISPEQGPYAVSDSDVNTLGDYVRAATRTLGHFNGEGHCEIVHLP